MLPSSRTDADLINLLRDDDEPAYRELYERYWYKMYVLAYRKLRCKEVAEELVQELFVMLWQKRASLRIVNLPAFLAVSLKNLMIDYIRRNIQEEHYLDQLRQFFPAGVFATTEAVQFNELTEALQQALAQLPANEYVQTQKDILGERTKPDAISLGSHWIDSHHVQRVAVSKTQFVNEGRIWEPISQPYEFSYQAIVPKRQECTNLLVPVCLSASHVAFYSTRVESTWMQLGNSAGIAAALAIRQNKAVQALDTNELRKNLKKKGVIVSVDHQVWNGTKDIK